MAVQTLIYLDAGGSVYGAQSEPKTEKFDSNIFLSNVLEEFKTHQKDRITIEELISRISRRLYDSGWFVPLHYTLVYPSNEQEILIGSYADRYKYANSSDVAFGLQLRTSFEEDGTVDIYTNNEAKDKGLLRKLADQLAIILNEILDPCDRREHLNEIRVSSYSIYDSSIEAKDLARGISHAEFPIVGLCFNVSPEGDFYKFLSSQEGIDKLVVAFSLYFDTIAEVLEQT